MAGSQVEGGMSKGEQLIGNLLVDALDDRFRQERLNVEFAFVFDTTVDTVLDDLVEALAGMGLRLAIPRGQCALLYDNSCNNASNGSATHAGESLHKGQEVDGVGGAELHVEGEEEDDSRRILSGADVIFNAPEVEAFYNLNYRCGLHRVATFRIVKRVRAPLPLRGVSRGTSGKENSDGSGDQAATEGLSVYLLHRKLQFDDLSNELLAQTNIEGKNEAHGDYKKDLLRVREMVAAAERSILTARQQHYQQQPPREPHWSVQLSKPPSRHEWLRAVEAETTAYDRLTAKIARDTTSVVTRQETSRRTLENEVAEFHQRIDEVKMNVVRREALQERVDRLKIEIEAQREKEQELLRSLERAKIGEVKRTPPITPVASSFFGSYAEQHPQRTPGVPPASEAGALRTHRDVPLSSRHLSPPCPTPPLTPPPPSSLPHEFVSNYSAIQGSNTGIGAATGSQFFSPSLREDVRQALAPYMRSSINAQPYQSDLQRLRQLAVELSHHLRSPNPDPVERRRLMGEIRSLRQEVERQREEESRVTPNP
ncbi:hypothetical protein TCDM_05138 [Trypanosoma cruzi Dm28c]|uniref:Uncharacterized protein n=2 Tax=Trypanosoma cruzi TaxID=5693 RepID=V5BJE8_TRYCR|nr:hypothetical protein TCDM_05138 [Trypanosoma cruzi Dm28c]PBJ71471.1 hypothetical protein BCY84_16814 [Trypanosoma cruzi cruzi]PWU94684.1 hypothetical protein C4B63_25g224 [Trypanosoma cruzi]